MTAQNQMVYRAVIRHVAGEIEERYARARIVRTEAAMREYLRLVGVDHSALNPHPSPIQ
jgi:hypothetical protein